MKNLLFLGLSLIFTFPTWAQPVMQFKAGDDNYVVEKLTEGHGTIWGVEFINSDLIIFTEKNGRIQTLDLKTGLARLLKNLPTVYNAGQGGLLDIAVHPEFAQNSFVYVTYAKKLTTGGQTTAVARARLDVNEGSFDKWEDIFVARPAFSTAHHYGSRIVFDKDGYIYFGVGERGQADLSQKLNAHNGKIIRLFDDGRIPQDNPFIGTPEALPEIWSYGHRNPQGLFYDKKTGNLYEQEHGPKGGDEINLVEKGKNYGWPVITYGREYSGGQVGRGETARPGMEQPLKYFVPSIAPSSLILYRGNKLKLFTDKFVSGALALQHLNLVAVKDVATACEDRLLMGLNERIRDVKQGPDGLVYVSSDNGRIYRIRAGSL